jgi:DNA-binding NtrC family response regulator
VITDLVMPSADGLSLVEWIRQRSDVPVIVMTGYPGAEQGVLSDYPEAKCLAKPYDFGRLLELVEMELGVPAKAPVG